MHDPTEGGLATGLWELAQRAKVGMHIYGDSIPVLPETRVLCDLLGLDPMGLLASGALLVVMDPGDAVPIQETIQREGIMCSVIGEVRAVTYGVQVEKAGTVGPLHPYTVDEVARIYGKTTPGEKEGRSY
jgi:hydrogenase maturation factor